MNISDINVSASVGNLRLITSGVLHVIDKPAKIKVGELEFVFHLSFGDGQVEFSTEVVNGQMVVTCKNLSSTLGEGVAVPVNFATINNSTLYLAWQITTKMTGDKTRVGVLQYSFYLEGGDE